MSVGASEAARQRISRTSEAAQASEVVSSDLHDGEDRLIQTDALVVAASTARGHVLIVEDDLIIADLIDQILRFESFQVSHVIDGKSAVDYAKNHVPDLILMDLMLPIMSGMDASRIIKSHPDEAVNQIPIVAMSAGVNLRATAHGLAVEGVLAKPFDIDELLATVDIHIRRQA
ncbi:MAG TPA: response regulator transcription factor [Thermomicrobiales bacterium]|nr:response regulator transcription factor [Thermomicrobiales bacterium]